MKRDKQPTSDPAALSRTTLLIGFLILLTATSCTSVFSVAERAAPGTAETRDIPGIPFYGWKTSYVQKTTYATHWYATRLEVSRVTTLPGQNGAGKEQVTTIGNYSLMIPASKRADLIIRHREALGFNIEAKTHAEIITFITALTGLSEDLDVIENNKATLIANTVSAVTSVDYDHPYYLNAPLPWFGGANVAPALSKQGVLSGVTADIDSKPADLLTALPDLLPLKELVSASIASTPTSEKPANAEILAQGVEEHTDEWDVAEALLTLTQPKHQFRLELSYKAEGYLYVFSRPRKNQGPFDPLSPDRKNGQFTRQAWQPKPQAKQAPSKKKDTNVITLSASLTLPKQAEQPSGADG